MTQPGWELRLNRSMITFRIPRSTTVCKSFFLYSPLSYLILAANLWIRMPLNDPNYRQGTEFTGIKQLPFQMTVSGWTLNTDLSVLNSFFLMLPVISQLCSTKQRHLKAQALGPGRPYVGPNSPPLLVSTLFTMWSCSPIHQRLRSISLPLL